MGNKVESFFSDIGYQLNLIKKYNSHVQKYLSSDFNVFEFINPDENKLSDVIADLLKPNGKHGQGDIFLKEFLHLIELTDKLNTQNVNATIYREASTFLIKNTQKRIDILIDLKHFGIVIENKPWATDQPTQLQDYSDFMRRRYGDNYTIIYLATDGNFPSELSISAVNLKALKDNGRYLSMYFRQGFLKWLNTCLNLCQSDKYRWFLRDFINYIEYNL
jgi:hypothetical protein